jgi:hypothetical protein
MASSRARWRESESAALEAEQCSKARNCQARPRAASQAKRVQAKSRRAPGADAPRVARTGRKATEPGRTSFARMSSASPVSILFSGLSYVFLFFNAAAFVWQSGKQSDRRGTGADQEPAALELDYGNEAAVAKRGGFADGKLLARPAYSYAEGP